MSRIARNILKSKRENRRKSESTCGVNILFEPFQEHVPDNSRLHKRVFLFIQEFLYMTVMSDMSRIVRNLFEFKCGNRQNALKYIGFVFYLNL